MTDDFPLDEGEAQVNERLTELTFSLPPMMTIETAEAVVSVFKELPITDQMTLTLDASKVEAITTPGLQILVSLEKTLASQGGRLRIAGAPDPFVHALEDTGLKEMLG